MRGGASLQEDVVEDTSETEAGKEAAAPHLGAVFCCPGWEWG